MGLNEAVNQAVNDFDEIEAAIEDNGVEVPDMTPTKDYDDYIDMIPTVVAPRKIIEARASEEIKRNNLVQVGAIKTTSMELVLERNSTENITSQNPTESIKPQTNNLTYDDYNLAGYNLMYNTARSRTKVSLFKYESYTQEGYVMDTSYASPDQNNFVFKFIIPQEYYDTKTYYDNLTSYYAHSYTAYLYSSGVCFKMNGKHYMLCSVREYRYLRETIDVYPDAEHAHHVWLYEFDADTLTFTPLKKIEPFSFTFDDYIEAKKWFNNASLNLLKPPKLTIIKEDNKINIYYEHSQSVQMIKTIQLDMTDYNYSEVFVLKNYKESYSTAYTYECLHFAPVLLQNGNVWLNYCKTDYIWNNDYNNPQLISKNPTSNVPNSNIGFSKTFSDSYGPRYNELDAKVYFNKDTQQYEVFKLLSSGSWTEDTKMLVYQLTPHKYYYDKEAFEKSPTMLPTKHDTGTPVNILEVYVSDFTKPTSGYVGVPGYTSVITCIENYDNDPYINPMFDMLVSMSGQYVYGSDGKSRTLIGLTKISYDFKTNTIHHNSESMYVLNGKLSEISEVDGVINYEANINNVTYYYDFENKVTVPYFTTGSNNTMTSGYMIYPNIYFKDTYPVSLVHNLKDATHIGVATDSALAGDMVSVKIWTEMDN